MHRFDKTYLPRNVRWMFSILYIQLIDKHVGRYYLNKSRSSAFLAMKEFLSIDICVASLFNLHIAFLSGFFQTSRNVKWCLHGIVRKYYFALWQASVVSQSTVFKPGPPKSQQSRPSQNAVFNLPARPHSNTSVLSTSESYLGKNAWLGLSVHCTPTRNVIDNVLCCFHGARLYCSVDALLVMWMLRFSCTSAQLCCGVYLHRLASLRCVF